MRSKEDESIEIEACQETNNMVKNSTSVSVYMSREERNDIPNINFDKVPEDAGNSRKLKEAFNFYQKISEKLKGNTDFGEDRTPDYIVFKLIEEHELRKETETEKASKPRTY